MRFQKLFSLALPVLTISALAACTSDVAPAGDDGTGQSTDDLVNAPRDTLHTWAVGVCASAPNTDPTKGKLGACVEKDTRCTGSLVAPNLVLTARHCTNVIDWTGATGFCDAHFSPDPLTTAGVRITLNESVLNENPGWVNVREVITSPTNNSCDDDVALLLLDTPVAADAATPISISFENLGTKWWLRPNQVAVVGRGLLTNLIDPTTLSPIDETEDLTRRYRQQIPFRCVSNQPNRCETVDITSPPSNSFTLPPSFILIGRGTASGDSGSSIIDQHTFTTNKPVTVGVLSAGTYGKDGVGNAGLAVRLDRHATWIKAAAVKAAAAAGAGTTAALADWAK